MIVDVELEDNRLIVTEADEPEELQSLTYINIVRCMPYVDNDYNYTVNPATVKTTQWYIRLTDANNDTLDIPLGNLASQPSWTNNQAGYNNAEAAIYAAFPTSGGGGPGTVTSVAMSGGTTGLTFSGGPITTSGTFTAAGTLAVANGGTGTTTGPTSTNIAVAQTAHGFSVGQALRVTGVNTYATAQADSASNAEVAGLVGTVTNANAFVLVTEGLITGLSGLTAGTTYYLSPVTPGALTATDPANPPVVGQVSKPVLLANSTTSGFVVNMRGMEITAPPAAPYAVYEVLMDQAGTSDPVVTTLANTIGSIAVTRAGLGQYEITSAALFTSGKTAVYNGTSNGQGPLYNVRTTYANASLISLNTYDDSLSPTDDVLFATPVQIKVYP